MRAHLREPLTVSDIAEKARLGPFPFSRLFRDETRLSPGRYLTALRIHEAKRLIGDSSMSTAEVAAAVGYRTPESFTDAFTAATGLPPGAFRRLCRGLAQEPPAPGPGPGPQRGALAGTVRLPAGLGNARVYLGAFATPLVQYPAAAAAVVDVPADRPSCYTLHDVPAGTWHLLAVAVAAAGAHGPQAATTPLVGDRATPVTVTADTVTSAALRLRPARPADPPVLLALPALTPPHTVVPQPGCPAGAPPPAARPRAVTAPPPSGA
ncbi:MULTISPECIES: helix-turn-helix domain-containing protein [unclassified Streptomyces]|uniref:helix-turn-helix domain-containing protein n=1 Tax=unclassified Streptomyces TaxID=2593676 RepID=UPI0035DBE4EF